MTLSSRHRIRNWSPGGLRPSTLPLGHEGSPQYWLSHVDGGETIFVSFKPPRPGTEPRTLAWKAAVLTTTLGPHPLAQVLVHLRTVAYLRTCILMQALAHFRTYTLAHMRMYLRTGAFSYLHKYLCTPVLAQVFAHLRKYLRKHLRTCASTCTLTHCAFVLLSKEIFVRHWNFTGYMYFNYYI